MIGPILYARSAGADIYRLAALIVAREDEEPLPLVLPDAAPVTPILLDRRFGRAVWRYDFDLPARRDASYRLGDETYPVAADLTGDVRIAYVSCDGQEHGDDRRPLDERNAMWRRLAAEHERAPFGLLLHGGDQLYADEVLEAHPALRRWGEESQSSIPSPPDSVTPEVRVAIERFYFERYLHLYGQPGIAGVCARVPSLMMWDDHDIVDGWGSLPAAALNCPIGRALFEGARGMFALFQLGRSGAEINGSPGASLSLAVGFPGFSVVAPDLRSARRPDRVMEEAGWTAFEQGLSVGDRSGLVIVMSSVPALGPRLSLVERLLTAVPGIAKYKDDLRDQWQSRAHRPEWRRFLRAMEQAAVGTGRRVVVVSGEIHLATRGEMRLRDGSVLHQLVASGIAHPAPHAAYAIGLGLLARLGEDPLPGQPIQMHPLPGHGPIYTAERNYMVLERTSDVWTAVWELEESGRTPALAL